MCNDIERSEITVMIPKAQPKVTYNDIEGAAEDNSIDKTKRPLIMAFFLFTYFL